MGLVRAIAYWVLWSYSMVLIGRVILSFIPLFVRDWRPRGLMLLIAETVYTLTDPPLRFIGRFVPPLRLGSVVLDLGVLLLFMALSLAMALV